MANQFLRPMEFHLNQTVFSLSQMTFRILSQTKNESLMRRRSMNNLHKLWNVITKWTTNNAEWHWFSIMNHFSIFMCRFAKAHTSTAIACTKHSKILDSKPKCTIIYGELKLKMFWKKVKKPASNNALLDQHYSVCIILKFSVLEF